MSERMTDDADIRACLAGEFGPCIPYAGYIDPESGYGKAWDGKCSTNAHRVAWVKGNGPVPDQQVIRHLCGNRSCVNLLHLRPGSQSENQRDRVTHGTHCWALKTHCPQGHPYDDVNTVVTRDGKRKCRSCENARRLARYHAKKGVA